jgi:hypothetical protein
VTTRLTPRGELELVAAMDIHFDGVRRMFAQYLEPADIDRALGLWSRIREATPATDSGGDQPGPA